MYTVAYQDSSVLVVDKPQGLATAPGRASSLCGLVYSGFPDLRHVPGYGRGEGALLNRLDNHTGGLVFFARSQPAFDHYRREMQAGNVEKKYAAVVHGALPAPQGTIAEPIGHAPNRSARMVIASSPGVCRGRPRSARTVWRVLAADRRFSVVELTLAKGMRHQVRVHLAHLGNPIVGDRLYTGKKGVPADGPFHLLYAFYARFSSLEKGPVVVTVKVPFLTGGAWGYRGPLA